MKATKQETDNVDAMEGLDTLANLAILGEDESLPTSTQVTTKHPRHRPGCSCIVCIQPPSGKGPKHKQTCTCTVCSTVKRRFLTLQQKREKKQTEKAETIRKKQQPPPPGQSSEIVIEDDSLPCSNAGDSSPNPNKDGNGGSDDDPNRIKSCTLPFKGQIDLNIQPEREEELSPRSDSGGMKALLDGTERHLRQLSILNSGDADSSGSQSKGVGDETREQKLSNGVVLGNNSHNSDRELVQPLTMNV